MLLVRYIVSMCAEYTHAGPSCDSFTTKIRIHLSSLVARALGATSEAIQLSMLNNDAHVRGDCCFIYFDNNPRTTLACTAHQMEHQTMAQAKTWLVAFP
jgi:hypothetical protein